jgi:hypothetical protein
MADPDTDQSCIICFEDLGVADSLSHTLQLVASTPDPSPPNKGDNKSAIASLPCTHLFHDACLKEWSEVANTCPKCRFSYNIVEVLDKIGGMSLFQTELPLTSQHLHFISALFPLLL